MNGKYIKRWAWGILLCCLGLFCLTSCGQTNNVGNNTLKVGVVYYDKSDTFLGMLVDCLKEDYKELEQDGIQISMMVRVSNGSQKTQNRQIQELIESGCNMLCVNLVDRSDPSNVIDAARDNDIPIIFFNREPVGEDMYQWDQLYYVGADANQSGTLQGELAVELIRAGGVDRNRDGIIQYVVLEGEAGHQDAIVRTENSVNTIKKYGIELEKLSYQIANWNRAQGQNRMEQLIAGYQSKIELVLANNDDMALGAVDAYKRLNYTEDNWPVILGVDGTKFALEALLSGELNGTVYNDKEGQARAIAELSVALYTGKGMDQFEIENDRYIYLPYYKITSDNLDQYLEQ